MKTVKQIVEEASQLDEGLGSVSNPWNKAIIGAHTGLTFKDMPMVIIFQRKSIRTFPDNQMVGLYYAQGIDQYLSLPFNSETGQFFKEEVETVTIRENFNDNLIALRQEGALANAASGVAREVGRRMKDYAVDTVKSGVRKARLGLGIDKLDTRTPADNLDKTRKDYGGVGTQIYNTLDTDRRRTAAEYRQHYGSNDPEPEANVKENFCNTLYTLRQEGMLVNAATSIENTADAVVSGTKTFARRVGITDPDPRTPADNLDDTTDHSRQDEKGISNRVRRAIKTHRRGLGIQYRNDNQSDTEAKYTKENFSNTLHTLREQGVAVQMNKTVQKAKNRFMADRQKTADMYKDQAQKQQDLEADAGNPDSPINNDRLGQIDKGMKAAVKAADDTTIGRTAGKLIHKGIKYIAGVEDNQDKEEDVIKHEPDDSYATWLAKKAGNYALRTGTKTIGPMMAGPNATGPEKEAATTKYAKYVGAAFASKGLESISGYRQARAERALGHVAQDRTAAGKQNAKIEEPGKTEPKPPPKPAPPVSAPAVPRPLRTPPRRSWSMRESVNLDTIKKMIKEDIKVSNLVFDEKEISISNMLAKKLFELYCSLNNENRKEMIRMLNENATSYRKLVQFSIKR